MLVSAAIAFPISAPPQQRLAMAPGNLLFSKTSAIILIVAIDTKGVVSALFHNIVSPHT